MSRQVDHLSVRPSIRILATLGFALLLLATPLFLAASASSSPTKWPTTMAWIVSSVLALFFILTPIALWIPNPNRVRLLRVLSCLLAAALIAAGSHELLGSPPAEGSDSAVQSQSSWKTIKMIVGACVILPPLIVFAVTGRLPARYAMKKPTDAEGAHPPTNPPGYS